MIKLLSIADIVTIMNALLGLLAILMLFSNQFQLAAALILLGLLADGLDGIIARRIGNGQMGEFLETLADGLTLSLTPLLLLYKVHYDQIMSQLSLQIVVVVAFSFSLICSMIRLSSFSTMKNKKFFTGLPTGANAVFLVLSSFLAIHIIYIVPFVVLFGLLMISSIHFPKHGLKSDIIGVVFIVAALAINFIYDKIAPSLLLLGLALYMVIGPMYLKMKKMVS
jgi:archaetidylserine synthase